MLLYSRFPSTAQDAAVFPLSCFPAAHQQGPLHTPPLCDKRQSTLFLEF